MGDPKKQALAELTDYAKKKTREGQERRAREEAQARKDAETQRELERLRARAAVADEYEKTDPLDLLEKRGVTADQIGDRIIKKGTLAEEVAQLKKAQKEREERDERERAELQERAKRSEAERAIAQAKRKLLDARDEVKGEHPLLAKLSEAALEREYMATYRIAAQDPEVAPYLESYSDAEILKATAVRLQQEREAQLEEYDDDLLEKHLTKRRERASSNAAEPGKSPGAPGRQSEESASSRTAKPLTHAVTAGTTGSWKPDNWDKLSDREQNAILTDRLQKRLSCD